MGDAHELLARGPWEPSQVSVGWRSDHFRPDPEHSAEADEVLQRLRDRGSPAHDGLAARMVGFELTDAGLALELQPIRWSLRLLGDASASLSSHCVVRDSEGRWLAGRRAQWVAAWAGRWALGAGGAVEVDENPVDTLVRELQEEWSVEPERLAIEALTVLPNGMVMIIGQAWLAPGAAVKPDHEHDEFAWWPAQLAKWPTEGDAPLLEVASLLTQTRGY